MDAGGLCFGALFSAFAVAVVAKGWLFLAVVQEGLRRRGVMVDEGLLALRGTFGRYTRTYLALLDAGERRRPGNRWVARLQWLVPLLGAGAALSALLASSFTGQ
ncbi:hypothetical protein [Stenotrophomonas mori]|uniref:Uncharacterized protein n=1 Tax=Stenotrophomonas mori TaxID=2871096 RepID=A0ABT0SEZ9_9GAMM|nr:hypothetical protein [Stenotrophomonas mori]MCL7713706.1 hypothetical protein [Stenotrophomonas mori]